MTPAVASEPWRGAVTADLLLPTLSTALHFPGPHKRRCFTLLITLSRRGADSMLCARQHIRVDSCAVCSNTPHLHQPCTCTWQTRARYAYSQVVHSPWNHITS